MQHLHFTAVVPAAGVGSRMQADKPKQYLQIGHRTLLEHTLQRLISHPRINNIVVAVSPQDPYFEHLTISREPWLTRVDGGETRADSVLAGLKAARSKWVLVHDGARPCVTHHDLDKLLDLSESDEVGGILAYPVRDTMKRSVANNVSDLDKASPLISTTEERDNLWHALTPQMFLREQLKAAIEQSLQKGLPITDEASAIEAMGGQVRLVRGCASNIKVTQPEDLALAEFYLRKQSCE